MHLVSENVGKLYFPIANASQSPIHQNNSHKQLITIVIEVIVDILPITFLIQFTLRLSQKVEAGAGNIRIRFILRSSCRLYLTCESLK